MIAICANLCPYIYPLNTPNPSQTENREFPRINPRLSCWTLIAVALFTLSMSATVYFGWQIRRSEHVPLAGLLAADKGYGVTTDLTQYQGIELTRNLALMYESGFTWIRQPIPWNEIETTPNEIDWSAYDRIIEAVSQFNAELPSDTPAELQIKLITVLHTTPTWARAQDSSPTTPPKKLHDFGRFARLFATRYGDQVNHYQIWHEPNLSANWGNRFVDPAEYTRLLREATVNIKATDPQAIIISAGLAPTLEDGPLNLNEMAYLDQLYAAHAERWFDVVATQIYGFATEPEQSADPTTLGFSRTELLRQVMLNHGDAETPIWATAFGWAVFDDDWTGRKSLWKQAIPAVQTQRTANAILHVRHHWPWLGPILAIRWDTADLVENDPAFAFALTEHPDVLGAFQTMSNSVHVATIGQYPANHVSGRYRGDWRFSEPLSLADVPVSEPRRLKIAFEGTRFDLSINRGPYRGYLWVTVDKDEAAMFNEGERFPANGLPTNNEGQSYVVLYDPLYGQETVTLARHLTAGYHEVEIVADGGWWQWPIEGWTVYNEVDSRPYWVGLMLTGLLAVITSLPTFWLLFRTLPGLAEGMWALAEIVITIYATLGERIHIGLTFGLGIALYLAPEWLALAILPLLGLTIWLRPDLGLALILFSLSFFQAPVDLPFKDFSPVEFSLMLTVLGLLGRGLVYLGRRRYISKSWTDGMSVSLPMPKLLIFRPIAVDYAVLALLILTFIATLFAKNFGVSMHEWRTIVVGSVLFYGLIRLRLDFTPRQIIVSSGSPNSDLTEMEQVFSSTPKQLLHSISMDQDEVSPTDPTRWYLRLIDAWVAGAVCQTLIALYLYFFTDQSITAEGVRRVLGLAYGSPNNLALFLERVWPILLVVGLIQFWEPNLKNNRTREDTEVQREHRLSVILSRPLLYLISFGLVSVAILLTFSKGTLLIALPLSLIAMTVFYLFGHGGRNLRPILISMAVVLLMGGLLLIPLSQTARFQTMFDLTPGSTTFFRVKLWQASWGMLQDHWQIGLGLDNFLYEYRTRYILPEAWQEPNLSHPHNLILDFGLRLGVGGILILLWLQWGFWQAAWRLYRHRTAPLILGLMGSMVTFLTHGLVDNSYFLVDLAFVFFLTLGVVVTLAQEEHKQSQYPTEKLAKTN
ncbi:O-antigen ligase family protein [Anaerolineales bacterium HSG24]|nr:O-antigen ligase family protein [Anaerolineales bacterium HSG24]